MGLLTEIRVEDRGYNAALRRFRSLSFARENHLTCYLDRRGVSRLVGVILSTDRAEPRTTSRLSSSAWTHSLFFAYICKAGERRTSATSMPQPPE